MLWLGYQGVEHTARHGGYDIVPYITNQSQTLEQLYHPAVQWFKSTRSYHLSKILYGLGFHLRGANALLSISPFISFILRRAASDYGRQILTT
jgi:uncharacterized membrane protein YeiB